MARYTDAVCRLCRREGMKLFLKGDRCFTAKCGIERRAYPPGQHGQGRTRFSEYGVQLREKQKVKRMYGLLEQQFARDDGPRVPDEGAPGENLLMLLERRLDNVVFRHGLRDLARRGASARATRPLPGERPQAQTIPSMLVKAGARITVAREVAQGCADRGGPRGARGPQRAALARDREGQVRGDGEGAAGPRGHHDADPGAAHRRALLALAGSERFFGGGPMQQLNRIAKNWRELIRPRSLESDEGGATATYGRFSCEPLERGFGVTLGNALRRVLLSSLQGAAITSLRIERRPARVLHHPRGDGGRQRHRAESEGGAAAPALRQRRRLCACARRGEGLITAADLAADDSSVEILNPDHKIATLSSEADVEMEVTVGLGKGYVPAEKNKTADMPIGDDPDRLRLLAGHEGQLHGDARTRRSRDGLRQAEPRGLDRWHGEPDGRRRLRREDPEGAAHDLHQLRRAGRAADAADRGGDAAQREPLPVGGRARAVGAIGELPAEREHPLHRRAGAADRGRDAQDQELRPQVAERDQGGARSPWASSSA